MNILVGEKSTQSNETDADRRFRLIADLSAVIKEDDEFAIWLDIITFRKWDALLWRTKARAEQQPAACAIALEYISSNNTL